MRFHLSLLSTLGLIALVGCNESPPGGPGAQNTSRGSRAGLTNPAESFRLEAPSMATSIKQAESKTLTIKMSRGKNFDQDVNLEFSEAPHGVKITPKSHT